MRKGSTTEPHPTPLWGILGSIFQNSLNWFLTSTRRVWKPFQVCKNFQESKYGCTPEKQRITKKEEEPGSGPSGPSGEGNFQDDVSRDSCMVAGHQGYGPSDLNKITWLTRTAVRAVVTNLLTSILLSHSSPMCPGKNFAVQVGLGIKLRSLGLHNKCFDLLSNLLGPKEISLI